MSDAQRGQAQITLLPQISAGDPVLDLHSTCLDHLDALPAPTGLTLGFTNISLATKTSNLGFCFNLVAPSSPILSQIRSWAQLGSFLLKADPALRHGSAHPARLVASSLSKQRFRPSLKQSFLLASDTNKPQGDTCHNISSFFPKSERRKQKNGVS